MKQTSQKASELLLQSAEPFDKACVLVKEMEDELDSLRSILSKQNCDTYVGKLKELSGYCFDIEKTLPNFSPFDLMNDEQYLRQMLYQIRCNINSLQSYAEIIDKQRIDNKEHHDRGDVR